MLKTNEERDTMLLIALRNLLQEKTRLIMSIAGVMLAVMLMFLLIGIYNGAVRQFTLFIDKNPTDVFVSKKGVSDMFLGVSQVPLSTIDDLRSEPGIKSATPLIAQRSVVQYDDTKYLVYVTSFTPGAKQGAPWEVSKGKLGTGVREATISEPLSRKINQGVGGLIWLMGKPFTITGLVPEGSRFGTHFVWVPYDTAAELTKMDNVANFAQLQLDHPEDAQQVADDLNRRYEDVQAFTKAEFAENNRADLVESFLPIDQAMVSIAFIIGIAVIGLTIYTATVDKAREYGVLKAIGVSNRQLYRIVLMQALSIMAVGLILGTTLSLGISGPLGQIIGVTPLLSVTAVLQVGGAILTMGFIASFTPVRRLTKIDPAEVFRS